MLSQTYGRSSNYFVKTTAENKLNGCKGADKKTQYGKVETIVNLENKWCKAKRQKVSDVFSCWLCRELLQRSMSCSRLVC